MNKILTTIAAAMISTSALAVDSYWEHANETRDGSFQDIAFFTPKGDQVSAWENYSIDIHNARTAGFTGAGVRIAITEPDNNQIDTPYTIGDYSDIGSHEDRMARMAGGIWVDSNGNKVTGVAVDAEVDIVGQLGIDRRIVLNPDGSFSHEEITSLPANSTLHTYDIANASFSSTGDQPTLGYNTTTFEGYDITDAIERSHQVKGGGLLYVTSAGNGAKTDTINDSNVNGILNAHQADNLLIVTGLQFGNSAKNGAQADRMVTAPYTYAGINGTSHATAGVSGMVAIIMDKFDINSSTAANTLLDTADSNFDGYDEMRHGQGKVNLGAALSPIGTIN